MVTRSKPCISSIRRTSATFSSVGFSSPARAEASMEAWLSMARSFSIYTASRVET